MRGREPGNRFRTGREPQVGNGRSGIPRGGGVGNRVCFALGMWACEWLIQVGGWPLVCRGRENRESEDENWSRGSGMRESQNGEFSISAKSRLQASHEQGTRQSGLGSREPNSGTKD